MATTLTRQDSRFYTHKLDNGLQMVGQFIPGVQSAATVFWVCTGTRDEEPEQMGISHFLEHMAFRKTEHYTGSEIDQAFEEMGADHNAATWLEMTFYWSRVLNENVSWSLDVLSELLHPVLDADDFDQEREVILQEIARYEDLPTHVLIAHFMRDFFRHHPLSRETLGTTETIKAMTVEQMREYWRKRYSTHNVIFAIAGNFDWDSVIRQVDALTVNWNSGEASRNNAPAQFSPDFRMYQREKFVQQQIAIGTPTVSRNDPRYFAAALLATILGDDTGSRLYWALPQTGLAETASAQIFEFDDNGLLFVHVATESEKAEEALKVARAELKRLQSFDVTADELERAKAKLNTSVIIGGESTNERVMGLIRSWLSEGRLETLEEVRSKIESVSLEDLKALLSAYPLAPDQVITTVGPMPEGQLSLVS